MPWKQRGGRGYYYRNERVGSKVVSHYVGRGNFAEAVSALIDEGQMCRAAERERIHREREAFDAADALLEDLSEIAHLLLRAELLAAGYHQHHRGEWRRRREQSSSTSEHP